MTVHEFPIIPRQNHQTRFPNDLDKRGGDARMWKMWACTIALGLIFYVTGWESLRLWI